MLDRLISKLSISGSDDQNPDHHASGNEIEQRFETDINVYPERASKPPRISPDVSYFLSMHGEDVGEALKRPIAIVPQYDSSLSLASYFVSTSHNTYLVGDQLWGGASPSSYKHVLANGAHCVEIDVWPGSGPGGSEPIVTHGWTLTQDILFKDVCTAINEAVEIKVDDWPVFVSLECHVEVEGQKELVEIMRECWGERLLSTRLEGVQGDNVSPRELKNRIVMMIEHYPPEASPSASDSESSKDSDSDPQQEKKKVKISDELTALGIYALSTKPKKNWLQEKIDQLHILINISESALLSLLPHDLADLVSHGQRHLRRVYPRGTRIMSDNLDPLVAWRAGSHFAALNWQEYDFGVQVNEAMFVGSSGWIPKPASMLEAGVGETNREGEGDGRVGLSIDVVGLSSLTHPEGKKDFRVRIRIYLLHQSGNKEWKSNSVKCKTASEAGADGMANENCVWAFDKDDLAFLRVVVEDDDEPLGLFCARLQHVQQGYRFIRLLDEKGKYSHSTLLVNCTISSID